MRLEKGAKKKRLHSAAYTHLYRDIVNHVCGNNTDDSLHTMETTVTTTTIKIPMSR